MTLVRTALRLAAVNALLDKTVAQNRVADSRIPALDLLKPADRKPFVVVTTEGDSGPGLGPQDGGAPYHRVIDLIFECSIATVDADEQTYTIGMPETDDELEAELDLLEYQIQAALWSDLGPAAVLFRQVALRSAHYDSTRFKSDQSAAKLASRLLILSCQVRDDVTDAVYRVNGGLAIDVQPTGYDLLPAPLSAVAKALPAGSYGKAVCDALVTAMRPLTAPPLTGYDLTADADPTGSMLVEQAPQIVLTVALPQ
jgi:hypothetical protein